MLFEISLTDEEMVIAKEYSDFHNIKIDEAFKQIFFEKLEDEYDLKVSNEAYNEYVKTGKQSRPVQDLWNELGL